MNETPAAIVTMQNAIDEATAATILSQTDLVFSTEPLTICAYNSCFNDSFRNIIKQWIDKYRDVSKSHPTTKQVVFMCQKDPNQSLDSCPRLDNMFMRYSRGTLICQSQPDNSVHMGYLNFPNLWVTSRTSNEGISINEYGTLAAEDLVTILLNRSREMAPGGILTLRCLTRDNKGNHFGNWSSYNMFTMMADIWSDFAEKGIITKEEKTQTGLCVYFRSEEEFVSPFKDSDGYVRSSGLQLLNVKTCYTEDILSDLLPQNRQGFVPDNSTRDAVRMLHFLRETTEPYVRASLQHDRSNDQKEAIMDIFYSRCSAILCSKSSILQYGAYETCLTIKKSH